MRSSIKKTEEGVVLIIALIVLVAMTLAALAIIRSVDTNNLIAGNLAFQQAATHSADLGIESATTWLNSATDTTLAVDVNTEGYVANGSDPLFSPDATNDKLSWDNYWNRYIKVNRSVKTLTTDASGNTVSYIIDRLCPAAGSTDKMTCVISPTAASLANSGGSASAGSTQPNPPHPFCYRITVRVDGPHSTVSYVQSIVYK
ncbi:hypothetical protein [Rhodoferax sp. GW822-FHT02A01]|uniref:pilus assembly PilX family protein n=1 Tax=Rhodoferax sp. GW822-FHT02A01 TaxID=3141537 RepID=UPI00315DD368